MGDSLECFWLGFGVGFEGAGGDRGFVGYPFGWS